VKSLEQMMFGADGAEVRSSGTVSNPVPVPERKAIWIERIEQKLRYIWVNLGLYLCLNRAESLSKLVEIFAHIKAISNAG
jgi:hypothetical protein